jgi:hypothetical protein
MTYKHVLWIIRHSQLFAWLYPALSLVHQRREAIALSHAIKLVLHIGSAGVVLVTKKIISRTCITP